jgi:hypothetical protein
MNPGGSITEVAGMIIDVLRGGGIPRADTPVQAALEFERSAHAATWSAVSLVMRAVTLVVALVLLRAMLRERPAIDENAAPQADDRVALGTGALLVAVITLASHRFQAWYLLGALPFFGLCCPPAWRRWWVAVVAVSVTTEFVYVMPRTARILPVWVAATTGATVLAFLGWFRARYFHLEDAQSREARSSS